MRVLELFCGIGGCAEALRGMNAEVVGALDINHRALEVYRHNFPHPVEARSLDSLPATALASYRADLWWLSPPCQPFTRRGLRRDDEDPRSRALLHLARVLPEARPSFLALENVPGFETSRTREVLLDSLLGCGYAVRELELCPSELGVPNRRRRYYLLAGLELLGPIEPGPSPRRPLHSYLDPEPDVDLALPAATRQRYQGALHEVEAEDENAVTTCFTAAYGRSPVRSGSFLRTANGLRRFSPAEILRLLGFSPDFRLPEELPRSVAWRLVGNSLSLEPVRRLLATVPTLVC